MIQISGLFKPYSQRSKAPINEGRSPDW